MTATLWLLAQNASPGTGANPGTGAPPPGPGNLVFFAAMMALLVFMILSQVSRSRREKREREQLFSSMSKNDKVVTIGGIFGTIVQVKENEVVLKVDESTNTKMTFRKAAISQILRDEPPSGK